MREAEGFEVAGFEDGAGAEDRFGVDVEVSVLGRVGRGSGSVDPGIGVCFLPDLGYKAWSCPDVGQDPEDQAVGVCVHSNSS